MRKALILALCILTALLLASSEPLVLAEENPGVATYDVNGNLCDRFNVGDDVNITAYSNPIYGTYTIEVRDPGTHLRLTRTVNGGGRYTEIVSDITDELGWWEVKAGSDTTKYASAYYEVIPEVGTLMAIVASFGALAGFGTTKRLRLKLQ